jgi:hypothetical protein
MFLKEVKKFREINIHYFENENLFLINFFFKDMSFETDIVDHRVTENDHMVSIIQKHFKIRVVSIFVFDPRPPEGVKSAKKSTNPQ